MNTDEKNRVRKNEKQKGFRFSKRTINNLRGLIDDLGVVRNETEAVDLALEHLYTELKTREQMEIRTPFRCRFGETIAAQAQAVANCV